MINYGIFAIGIMMIIVALFVIKKDTAQGPSVDLEKVKEEQRRLMECIEIGEEIIQEVNQVGIHVIEKIDKKTQELRNLMNQYEVRSLEIQQEAQISKVFEEEKNDVEKEIEEEIKKQKNEAHRMEKSDNPPEKLILEEDLSEKILKLKASGYTLSQIARELDKGIGEVQLILQLKKR